MKDINLSMASGHFFYSRSEIRQGENLASRLNIILSDDFLGYTYNLIFKLNDKTPVLTEPLTSDEDNSINYILKKEVTYEAGILQVEIQASDPATGLLAKSSICRLKVIESIDGSFEVMPEEYVPWVTVINTAVAAATEQAGLAEGYATTAGEQAAIAEGHATTAGEQAGIATTQAGIAEGHATTASQQAGIASGHATTASTKATEASGYATTASTKATEASGYATTASTKATEASGYATTAGTKATEASGYAATASTKATEASGYATTATQQAVIAGTKATEASGYATTASTKATEASGYATTAGTKATEASGYAATASTKATEASGYAESANPAIYTTVEAISDIFTADISFAALKNFSITLSDAVSKTIIFSNVPSGRCEIFLELVVSNLSAVIWTLNTGSALAWASGSAPNLSAGKTYRLLFMSSDSGATWDGFASVGV